MRTTEPVVSATEASGVVGYEPETPFVVDGAAKAGSPLGNGGGSARQVGSPYERESPFLSEYALDPGAASPEAELYAEVLSELEDPEFEEAIGDLVHEA